MPRIKGWTILATILATHVVVVLFLNFSSGEKKIEQQNSRLYATDHPQFRRSLSALLGPQLLDGNKVEELLNGDQIFPVMLAEIRGDKRTITLEVAPEI